MSAAAAIMVFQSISPLIIPKVIHNTDIDVLGQGVKRRESGRDTRM